MNRTVHFVHAVLIVIVEIFQYHGLSVYPVERRFTTTTVESQTITALLLIFPQTVDGISRRLQLVFTLTGIGKHLDERIIGFVTVVVAHHPNHFIIELGIGGRQTEHFFPLIAELADITIVVTQEAYPESLGRTTLLPGSCSGFILVTIFVELVHQGIILTGSLFVLVVPQVKVAQQEIFVDKQHLLLITGFHILSQFHHIVVFHRRKIFHFGNQHGQQSIQGIGFEQA